MKIVVKKWQPKPWKQMHSKNSLLVKCKKPICNGVLDHETQAFCI